MRHLQIAKDLGLELQIMQNIRFGTKINFDINSLDKFIDDIIQHKPIEIEEPTEESPISLNELIEVYGLKTRTRKQMVVYNRMVLVNHLKANTMMTLQFIGSHFNLGHDTVLYYLAQYERLKKDKFFRDTTINLTNDLKRLTL